MRILVLNFCGSYDNAFLHLCSPLNLWHLQATSVLVMKKSQNLKICLAGKA